MELCPPETQNQTREDNSSMLYAQAACAVFSDTDTDNCIDGSL